MRIQYVRTNERKLHIQNSLVSVCLFFFRRKQKKITHAHIDYIDTKKRGESISFRFVSLLALFLMCQMIVCKRKENHKTCTR